MVLDARPLKGAQVSRFEARAPDRSAKIFFLLLETREYSDLEEKRGEGVESDERRGAAGSSGNTRVDATYQVAVDDCDTKERETSLVIER